MKTYHVGLLKGSGRCFPLHRNGHRRSTLVIQARRSIDALSPQLWEYVGERKISKNGLRRNASKILAEVNAAHGTNFTHAVVD